MTNMIIAIVYSPNAIFLQRDDVFIAHCETLVWFCRSSWEAYFSIQIASYIKHGAVGGAFELHCAQSKADYECLLRLMFHLMD